MPIILRSVDSAPTTLRLYDNVEFIPKDVSNDTLIERITTLSSHPAEGANHAAGFAASGIKTNET